MNEDENHIDWDDHYGGPSRSVQRREALDVLALAKELAALPEGDLAAIPLNDALRHQVNEARRITQPIAHKRQVQYLAKHLRKHAEEIPAIRLAVDAPKQQKRRATAQLHHAETWRDRLVADGDEAINALLAEHPDADRQQLRQLVRQANAELKAGKPPAASRQIFRIVRELIGM
jgi:ribosome-associated protein